jgi:hypothetical protein
MDTFISRVNPSKECELCKGLEAGSSYECPNCIRSELPPAEIKNKDNNILKTDENTNVVNETTPRFNNNIGIDNVCDLTSAINVNATKRYSHDDFCPVELSDIDEQNEGYYVPASPNQTVTYRTGSPVRSMTGYSIPDRMFTFLPRPYNDNDNISAYPVHDTVRAHANSPIEYVSFSNPHNNSQFSMTGSEEGRFLIDRAEEELEIQTYEANLQATDADFQLQYEIFAAQQEEADAIEAHLNDSDDNMHEDVLPDMLSVASYHPEHDRARYNSICSFTLTCVEKPGVAYDLIEPGTDVQPNDLNSTIRIRSVYTYQRWAIVDFIRTYCKDIVTESGARIYWTFPLGFKLFEMLFASELTVMPSNIHEFAGKEIVAYPGVPATEGFPREFQLNRSEFRIIKTCWTEADIVHLLCPFNTKIQPGITSDQRNRLHASFNTVVLRSRSDNLGYLALSQYKLLTARLDESIDIGGHTIMFEIDMTFKTWILQLSSAQMKSYIAQRAGETYVYKSLYPSDADVMSHVSSSYIRNNIPELLGKKRKSVRLAIKRKDNSNKDKLSEAAWNGKGVMFNYRSDSESDIDPSEGNDGKDINDLNSKI